MMRVFYVRLPRESKVHVLSDFYGVTKCFIDAVVQDATLQVSRWF